jgi:hypothetical protein
VFAFGPDALLFTVQQAGRKLQRPTSLAYSPEGRLLYVVDTSHGPAFGAGGAFAFSFGERGEARAPSIFPPTSSVRVGGCA